MRNFTTMIEQPSWKALLAASLFALSPVARASGQIKEGFDDRTTPEEWAPHTHMDTLQILHTIHVSPKALYFNSANHSATVTLENSSDRPIQGNVLILYAFPTWPHKHPADTTVITQNMEMLQQQDTTVAVPSPKDRFAGKWLSPIPLRVSIPAHKSQQVKVQLNPPANLPAGEYWVRIVVQVNPQDQNRRGNGQDTRQRYALPIKGQLPALRDSVIVFYRQGPVKAGVSFGPGVVARFDSVGYGGPDGRDCPHSLWIRLPMHLTGNAHVDGTLLVTYKNVETGDVVKVNKFEVSLYRDEITHWWTHTCWVAVGKYKATLQFQPKQQDVPADQRLPIAPVTYTIPTPFDIMH